MKKLICINVKENYVQTLKYFLHKGITHLTLIPSWKFLSTLQHSHLFIPSFIHGIL